MIQPIKGLESSYTISSKGEVFSIKSNRLLKTGKCTSGYAMAKLFVSYCTITTKRVYKYIRVHRLVAEHFIPNQDASKFTQVNHIDGNKLNNRVANLEWVTPSQNMCHAFDTGLNTKPTALSSDQMADALTSFINGEPLRSLMKHYGVSKRLLEWLEVTAFASGQLTKFKQVKKNNRHNTCKNTGKLISSPVIQKDMLGNEIKEWESMIDAAKSLGIGQGNISNVLAGRSKSCGGFLWERK